MNRRKFLKGLIAAPIVTIAGYSFAKEVWDAFIRENSNLPIGYVTEIIDTKQHFAGIIKTDNGWIPIDGRAVSRSEYPELYRVMGKTYGGKGNTFNLPDFRGYLKKGKTI